MTDASFTVFEGEVVEDREFREVVFRHARFGKAVFRNCRFLYCDFGLALFETGVFENCYFYKCDLVAAFGGASKWRNCYAYACNFELFRGERADLDFISTELSRFDRFHFGGCSIPSECREIIGEIIRQVSDSPRIVAWAALVKTYTEFCWETILRMGQEVLSIEEARQVLESLAKYPNLKAMLNKMSKKVKLDHVISL